jgi:hypothetical protein
MLVGHQHQDVRPCLSIYVDNAREVTAGLGDDKAAGDRQVLFSEAIGGDLRCPDRTNGDIGSPDRAGGNLRCPNRIEREVHARYGAVDNVRRIDAWRDLALRFGPMGWRPEQKHEDAKQKCKTRETRHKLLRCHGGYLHDAEW